MATLPRNALLRVLRQMKHDGDSYLRGYGGPIRTHEEMLAHGRAYHALCAEYVERFGEAPA